MEDVEEDININMESGEAILLPSTPLYLKNVAGKGRGVYAAADIPSRTLINISPVLLFPDQSDATKTDDKDENDDTTTCSCQERKILSHYTYTFNNDFQALALGMGSMFNHSRRNNVGFIVDKENLLIRYTTIRDVEKDSELLINYGNKLWFVDNNNDCDSDTESDTCENPFERMIL